MTDWTEMLSEGWEDNCFVLQSGYNGQSTYEEKYLFSDLMITPTLSAPSIQVMYGDTWLEFQIKDYSPKDAGSLKIKEDESYYYTYYYLYVDLSYTPFSNTPQK